MDRLLILCLTAMWPVMGAFAGEKTSLEAMLLAVRQDPKVSRAIMPLECDWIGDIREGGGEVKRLRLEKGQIEKGQIVLLRTYPNGGYTRSDAPAYRSAIPSDAILRKCTTAEEVKKLLGSGDPAMSAGDSLHWVCFNFSPDQKLSYLEVSVQPSWERNQSAGKDLRIQSIQISRGELFPAKPESIDEKKRYLSGANLFALEEQEKAKNREHYPQPLRDLVAIDERPDDSDLTHLSAALQAIRDKPDPKLFVQIVSEMHEGTMRIQSLLEHILVDEDLLKLKPWKSEQKEIAIRACLDALPQAREDAPMNLVELILRASGGGKIDFTAENGGRTVEVKINKDGHTFSYDSSEHSPSLEETQKELLRIFLQSEGRGKSPQ